jgi:hypothetical protein
MALEIRLRKTEGSKAPGDAPAGMIDRNDEGRLAVTPDGKNRGWLIAGQQAHTHGERAGAHSTCSLLRERQSAARLALRMGMNDFSCFGANPLQVSAKLTQARLLFAAWVRPLPPLSIVVYSTDL